MEQYMTIPFPSGKAAVYISLAPLGDMGSNREPVKENRRAFFKATGLKDEAQYPRVLEIVHSHTIYDADELSEGLLPGDGIISREGIPLGTTVADCVPIFLLDTRTGVTGAFHSGWRGTGIAAEGVLRMVQEYGCHPQDIEAVIGPAIGGCCYDVDKERYEYFLETFGPAGLKKSENIYSLDLKLVNYNILSDLKLKNIVVSDVCTCCDTRFFSFRRAMAEGTHFSRMLAYIRNLE